MRFAPLKTLVLSAGLALFAGNASAAVITATYAVTGSSFSSATTPPFASITESVTITFDTSVLVSEQAAGITLNPSTIMPSSTLAFTYIPGTMDTLIVGGTAMTVVSSDANSTDFAFVLRNASNPSAYTVSSLSYSVGNGSVYSALTFGPAAAAVPEPASLALLGGAVAAIGLIRKRRRAC